MKYTSETTIYNKDAIGGGIDSAAKSATDFMEYKNGTLTVGKKSGTGWTGSRATMDSDSFDIVDSSGDPVASYGATATIGKADSNNIQISSDGVNIMDNATSIASFGESVRIGCDNAMHVEISNSSMGLIDGCNRLLEFGVVDGAVAPVSYPGIVSNGNGDSVPNYSAFSVQAASMDGERKSIADFSCDSDDSTCYIGVDNGQASASLSFTTDLDRSIASIHADQTSITGVVSGTSVEGGSWIRATKDATFAVPNKTSAAANSFAQGFMSCKVYSGAWAMSGLSGSNDLYFTYGTDANYNANTNSTAQVQLHSDGTIKLNPSLAITAHQVVAASQTIAAHSSISGTTSAVTKTGGWYPLAIVGWNCGGFRAAPARLYLTERGTGTCKVVYVLGNYTTSQTTNAGLNVDILWCRA